MKGQSWLFSNPHPVQKPYPLFEKKKKKKHIRISYIADLKGLIFSSMHMFTFSMKQVSHACILIQV